MNTEAKQLKPGEHELDELARRIRNARTLPAPYALQLVILGAVIADKEVRDLVDRCDFIDPDLGSVLSELVSGTGDYQHLSKIMKRFGITWSKSDGAPLDALIERIKVDAEYDRALTVIENMIRRGGQQETTLEAKQWTIDKVIKAGQRLQEMKGEKR